MKRSEINAIIRESEQFLHEQNYKLPIWGYWKKKDWLDHINTVTQVMECQLGWDITDFGQDNFSEKGLVLFTVRNGILGRNIKPYAEKIMIVGEEQETPYHFHRLKTEDIINRDGGVLLFKLYGSTGDEKLSPEGLTIWVDGVETSVEAGEILALHPGQSLTLVPGVYHSFYGKKGCGPVMTGEVSSVNDDFSDNRFYEDLGRFPSIEEDEEPYRLLVSDYVTLKEGVK